MAHRYPLLIILTVLVVLACAYSAYMSFQLSGLPFNSVLTDAHTAVVEPVSGVPLPSGLQAGNRIDLSALSLASRGALLPDMLDVGALTEGQTYNFVIQKDGALATFPVASMNLAAGKSAQSFAWTTALFIIFTSVISLLLLWRGRDRAARAMAVWGVATVLGFVFDLMHGNGTTVVAWIYAANICWLLARVGFYVTIESMLGSALTPQRRVLFRWIFVLVLLAGAVQQLGGALIFVANGWAELVRPAYGLIFTASYVVPVIMLFLTYGAADAAHRLRLRWIMWSSVALMIAVGVSNTQVPLLGPIGSNALSRALALLMAIGFLYAVLRHRVVNVSVFINHTLAYGSVTALVVGILAAVNSIVQHAALGTSASLLLQIVVPLALGAVLGQVRSHADKFVERVFFRRKYLAEQALRRFARHSSGYDRADSVLAATTQIIREKLNAPDVVIYTRKDNEYVAAARAGEFAYPATLPSDDGALAAARAGAKDIDLSECPSTLGTDGYVFPVGIQAVLVSANRPGEHYASDERKLLAYVAGKVGIALQALRVQEQLIRLEHKASLVDALASGALDPAAVREQVLKMETAWE